jgi:hypothetical protein
VRGGAGRRRVEDGRRAVARDGEGLIQVTDQMRQGDAITASGGAAGWRFHIGGLDQYSVALSSKLCFFAFCFPSSSLNNEITTN